MWQSITRGRPKGFRHLVIALADHFEPSISHKGGYAEKSEQVRRLHRWCSEYPKLVDPWRDSDGYPFRHTYFSPAEQYDPELVNTLANHCHEGWGEVEIHLHHGVEKPDNSVRTRELLESFRDNLATDHGCLSRDSEAGSPKYAFVHGNFALANSAEGRCCGVDDEIQILSDTGCYADMTLPSAPNVSQTSKINALYEPEAPLSRRAAHRWGRDLVVGRRPEQFPLILQGPLAFGWKPNGTIPRPYIENGAISDRTLPTLDRLERWESAGISVKGREDWVFIKLHCHGMDPDDRESMLGKPMREFLETVTRVSKESGEFALHFVTAREMSNIALAACDGRQGNPGDYRDYKLKLITGPKPGCIPSRS
jgi:hypothetical protein